MEPDAQLAPRVLLAVGDRYEPEIWISRATSADELRDKVAHGVASSDEYR